ncbi:hypothetical protein [Colwellia sp. MEBiC06753]
MELLTTAMTIFTIVSAIAFLAFLDKKFTLGLSDSAGNWHNWGMGQTLSNSEISCYGYEARDQEILALKARIEVLEKIVTDPAEQLKQQIDRL